MNIVVIILGIFVLILSYFLYTYYVKSNNLITKVDLNNGSVSLSDGDIEPSSYYTYSTWVFVNTWNTNVQKIIYSRGVTTGTYTKLYLDATTPTLKYVLQKDTTATKEVVITDNFPLQKWVHVLLSVDNNVVDFYINGKLVKSADISNVNTSIPEGNITLGSTIPIDMYLAMFNYTRTTTSPQNAWSMYLKGNGMSTSKMNVKLSVLQDNIEQKSFSIY